MNTDNRFQKSSTISVLKFNRISQNNCNVSQTESEISLNSIKKDSKTNANQNPSHSFRNIETSQTYFRRTNTYFNNVEQDDQRIDQFNELSGRQFTYTQDSVFAQPNSRRFELNLVSQAIKIQPTDRENDENTSKQEENTSKRQRSKWVDEISQQSQTISQKFPSKIQSDMKNSTDRFGILMDNMTKSLFEFKQFRNQIEKQESEEQTSKLVIKQKEIKQIQEKKTTPRIAQKTQSNYYLPKSQQEPRKQTVQQQQRNKSRAKSQNGIVVELREQVNAQFNRTPQRQPNYKSITPVRQIIKCVELSDNRNDKLFSVQYRLKSGKQINVVMRRHDNLIKVAQDAAQKHKLEHNGYLQLLKILKDKYRTILENQGQ